jgi:hypothetical protein
MRGRSTSCGWLLRLDAAPSTSLILDLAGPAVVLDGPFGPWRQPVGGRHAQILRSLARHPAGAAR